jgi:hypothetical protein
MDAGRGYGREFSPSHFRLVKALKHLHRAQAIGERGESFGIFGRLAGTDDESQGPSRLVAVARNESGDRLDAGLVQRSRGRRNVDDLAIVQDVAREHLLHRFADIVHRERAPDDGDDQPARVVDIDMDRHGLLSALPTFYRNHAAG